MPRNPVLLIILDGWGIRDTRAGNAVALAQTPNFDAWLRNHERSIIHSSGEHVGLTPGQMGNSEVGHLNLGAGRIVYQDISRIANAIADGSLSRHPILRDAIDTLRDTGKRLHLVGLLGSGGVHSHSDHLYALLDIASAAGIDPVLHLITDGRDTPTQQAESFCMELCERLYRLGIGRIATVSGRYYAMDRDQRWQRTGRAYEAMVSRRGDVHAPDALTAIRQSYAAGATDEFIPPTVIDGENLAVQSGDILLCHNFRADRMRQLCRAFVTRDFDEADNFPLVDNLRLITMTEYMDGLTEDVLFPVDLLHDTLAETISRAGMTQYHSAETEKYPHVTFFFNGRREQPFPGETRHIAPSPPVATYDLQPEMSARRNSPTPRWRGCETPMTTSCWSTSPTRTWSGIPAAWTLRCRQSKTVDSCAGELAAAVMQKGGAAIVTADHGNCERMVDPLTGAPHTYHTVAPVFAFRAGRRL